MHFYAHIFMALRDVYEVLIESERNIFLLFQSSLVTQFASLDALQSDKF